MSACTIALLGVTLFTGSGPWTVSGDAARDRREARDGRRALRDDWRDLRRFARMLSDYDGAMGRSDWAALQRLDREAAAALATEVRENRRELRREVREARRDERDLRDARSDAARADVTGRWSAASRDERRAREAARDLRDDASDARREAYHLERLRALEGEFRELEGRLDPPAVYRKRALLDAVVRLAGDEVQSDRREAAEDAREAGREPWREGRYRAP